MRILMVVGARFIRAGQSLYEAFELLEKMLMIEEHCK